MARSGSKSLIVAQRGELVAERDPRRPSGRLLLQGGMEASYVDLADVSYLEFDYMRWMQTILVAMRARRNLHLGGGACALARALAARNPEGLQVVCEADADVLAMAREFLGLRRAPGLRVRHAEGREFLAGQVRGSFDAVVIDAFVGARVAPGLVTREALADVARVAPLALINVVDDRSAGVVRAIADVLAGVYPAVWSTGARRGNTVLVGGRLAAPEVDRIAAELAADRSPAQLVLVAGGNRMTARSVAR
jgi:spermidine synthase